MVERVKRVVIKEELVALTGDYRLAIVLNQMIYWSERVIDFDHFIQEEKARLSSENMDASNLELQKGWIYKKAEELAEECMITSSKATMKRYMDKLIECGWIDCRKNPKYNWDKTFQYRVHLKKIQSDLIKIGYHLEGYRFNLNEIFTDETREFQNDTSKFQNETTEFQSETSRFQNDTLKFQDETAIPEITSKITSEEKEEEEERSVISFFEKNFTNSSSYIKNEIKIWCLRLDVNLVLKAMKLTLEYGGQSWVYVKRILEDWLKHDIHTLNQADEYICSKKKVKNEHKDPAAIRKGKAQKKFVRTEMVPDWLSNREETPSQVTSIPALTEERKRAIWEQVHQLKTGEQPIQKKNPTSANTM